MGEWLKRIWRKRIIVLAWLIPVTLGIWAISEWWGAVNFISTSVPYNTPPFAQIIGAFGSLSLSFLLVLLYHQQAEIQREAYTPHLTGEINSLNVVSSKFIIQNSGDGYAYEVKAEWEVGEQTNSWEIPSLAPGEEFGFAVIENEDGRWILNTSEIREYLEEQGGGTEIEYKIECEDKFGKSHSFDGVVDFEIQSKRSDAPEIWDKKPIENIENDLSDIQGDINDLKSHSRQRKKESKWKNRSRQTELLSELINEHGKMTIEELSYITGINESSLEYRLSGLDDIDAVRYNDTSGEVEPARKGDENHSLDEY